MNLNNNNNNSNNIIQVSIVKGVATLLDYTSYISVLKFSISDMYSSQDDFLIKVKELLTSDSLEKYLNSPILKFIGPQNKV